MRRRCGIRVSDEYGLRKLCYVEEWQHNPEDFPIFTPKGNKVGEKVMTAYYIPEFSNKGTLV